MTSSFGVSGTIQAIIWDIGGVLSPSSENVAAARNLGIAGIDVGLDVAATLAELNALLDS